MSYRVLVLTDLHYVSGTAIRPLGARQTGLGLESLRRALRKSLRRERADAVVLLGDLVDDGRSPTARDDLAALAKELAPLGVPVLALAGNHDGEPAAVAEAFGPSEGPLRLGPWRFVGFTDFYGPDDRAARAPQDLERLAAIRRAEPEAFLVALQHNPVLPAIESTYPYNLTNASEVAVAYARERVTLSLSGHYHPGIPPVRDGGVWGAVAPTLCEGPFRWLVLSLEDDGGWSVREERLSLEPEWGLVDVHCHTQWSYCARGYDAQGAIDRARLMGLARLHLTEHAGQLYVSSEDFWSARFQWEPAMLHAAREEGRDRVAAWRDSCRALRAPDVAFGLEVEYGADGRLTVLPEDLEGVDLVVGAVHWLRCVQEGEASVDRLRSEFLAQTEGLLRSGVDVLAHPFRIFPRNGCAQPEGVEEAVLDLLAEAGAAAEVNWHQNEPTVGFFRACRERGIPIVFGTDAHTPEEIADLHRHRALLAEVDGLSGEARDGRVARLRGSAPG